MSTPIHEISEPKMAPISHSRRNSDEEGTLSDELERPHATSVNRNNGRPPDHDPSVDTRQEYLAGKTSLSQSREEEHRLNDDLAMLQAERDVNERHSEDPNNLSHSTSMGRTRSRPEPIDQFDANTNPIHEKTAVFAPPEHPSTNAARMLKKIHDSSFLIRYFLYIVPLVLIILIPLLIGVFVFPGATVGGVKLLWFCVWLEVIWLTLWCGRIVAKMLPWPVGLFSSLLTNNSKKWKDMSRQLEIPATLFFWTLAVEISFLPIMNTQPQRWKHDYSIVGGNSQ